MTRDTIDMLIEANQHTFLNKLEEEVILLLKNQEHAKILELFAKLHVSELVMMLEMLDENDRKGIFDIITKEMYTEILIWLPSYLIQEIIKVKGLTFIVEVIQQIKDVDAPYLILKDLENKSQILDRLSVQAKQTVEKKLNYPKDSAGRLMQSYFIAVPETWIISDVLTYLQELKKTSYAASSDNLSEIFIIDDAGKAKGSVSLYNLLTEDNTKMVSDVRNNHSRTINTNLDQEEVAIIFRNRDFVTAAVVDENNILVGVITIDDVVDVIYKEAEEDTLLLSGVNADSHNNIYANLFFKANARLKWLAFNFIEALTLPFIIATFHTVIIKHVMITSLIQFVVALGGNAGAQSLSVTIRGLSLKLITTSNAYKQIARELSIALINGLILGLIGIVWGVVFGDTWIFGLIAFIAVLINVFIGTLFGTLFPVFFKKIGVDPAIASSICTTTFTDIFGYFIVLLIATILLV